MKQTKRASLVEAIVNVAIGCGISLVGQIVIFWLMDIPVSLRDDVVMVIFFTAISIVRSFALRRLFEALRVRGLLP